MVQPVISRTRGCAATHRFWGVVLAVVALCASSSVVLAVPAAPDVHTLRQPDGRGFEARRWGDEWLNGWETVDGYTIVLDRTSQAWAYAERKADGTLAASASLVGRDAPPEGVGLHLRPGGAVLERAHAMRASTLAVAGKADVPPTGTANVPVILINFSDTTTTYTTSNFNTLLFGSGTWSMRDYYSEVSYGKFTVSAGPGGVAGWFKASNTHDYYGSNNAEGKDVWPGDLVYEAVQMADAAGFNFAPYDSDGDCNVDVVNVIHQGAGAEVSGSPDTNIWSHSWNLYSAQYYGRSHYGVYTTNDTCPAGGYVKVNAYVIQPETYGSGMTTVGVFAHEFGHALGILDLYDTDGSSGGVGKWSLMAGGSWCGVSRGGDRPAHMDAWSKAALGWATPQQVTGTLTNKAIGQVETSAEIYQFLAGTPGQTGEYFLVENRQKVNFDAGLPGSGLLVWHIDESQGDNTKECYPGGTSCATQHFKVAVIQADNQWHLEKDTNEGDGGDPFPGSTAARSFTGTSSPSSALHNGQASGVSITSISDPATTMTATLAVGGTGGGGDVTVFSDNFEGSFPGSWVLWRNSGSATTEWGRVECTNNGGMASIWCAGGGASPATPMCYRYVGNMETWMIYGPFSLADATAARAEWDNWYDTETYSQSTQEGDQFEWMISTDGQHFSGYYTSGSSSGWTHRVFDFKDVTSITAVGNSTVYFAFIFKSDPYVEGGGTYVDNLVIKKTVATSCTYSISPQSQSFSSAGGTATVSVTAGSGCSWTASSSAGWITVTSGASGSGNGTVGYSVQANAGVARSGTLAIGDQTFTVSQAGTTCSYAISPTSASAAAAGGTGSFNVSAGLACLWTASSDSNWLHVTYASGSANGSVNYSVDANSGPARAGHITVESQTFTLNQAGAGVSLPFAHWIAAASHTDGTGGSHWRSDVAVLNRSSSQATVEYRLYTPGGLKTQQSVLGGNAQDFHKDIASWLGYTTGSGALEVRSNQDVFVMGRTYNQVDPTHSYGQNYDGQDPDASLLSAGQSAWLPLLAQNSGFRCNIAITNTGASTANVTLALYDGNGTLLWSGNNESSAIAAGGFIQYLTPFQKYGGRNNLEHAYAKVTVISGSGIIAWASVVDNATGDPTTIFMKR
jgi:M6 family metalloprotease-like protein